MSFSVSLALYLFWAYCLLRGLFPWVLLAVLILVWVGWSKHWKWVRNPWIRTVHLVLTLFLVVDIWHNAVGMTNLTDQFSIFLVKNSPLINAPASSLIRADAYIYLGSDGIQPIYFYSLIFLATLVSFFTLPPWWGRRTKIPT